jgi:hypothetical protein
VTALNPDQFFHGTTHNITDGMVRPADHADKPVSEYSFGDPGDMSEGDHAFAIRNDENYAWHAAGTFHKNGRRPRVYEVSAPHDMTPGPYNKAHPDFLAHNELDDPTGEYPPSKEDIAEAERNHQDEWASKTGFPVKRRIDIMPGHQGTFPSVNWNRYKDGAPAWGPDANHPSDAHIEHGMYPKEEPKPAPAQPRARQKGESLRDFMAGKPAPDPQGRLF